MSKVQGVVAIFTDENGHVIASVNDFDRSGYGGCKLVEAQRMRAERMLAYAVVNAYCSPRLVRAIEDYQAQHIVRRLITDHGCKRTIVEIGYGTEDS